MSATADIIGREILDSGGNPTVEVTVVLESGAPGRVTSARSRGTICGRDDIAGDSPRLPAAFPVGDNSHDRY